MLLVMFHRVTAYSEEHGNNQGNIACISKKFNFSKPTHIWFLQSGEKLIYRYVSHEQYW